MYSLNGSKCEFFLKDLSGYKLFLSRKKIVVQVERIKQIAEFVVTGIVNKKLCCPLVVVLASFKFHNVGTRLSRKEWFIIFKRVFI